MNKRQSKLYTMLQKNQNTPFAAAFYSKKLNVSKRTFYSDLNALDEIISIDGYTLNRIPGVGIYINKKFSKNSQLTESNNKPNIKDRHISIFKRLLIDEEIVSLKSLSESYFVSISSIRNDFKRIENDFLDNNTLYLGHSSKGTYLEGSENRRLKTHIKFGLFIYLNHHNLNPEGSYIDRYKDWYTSEIVESSSKVIKELENEGLIFVSDHYRVSLLITLIVLTFNARKIRVQTIEDNGVTKEDIIDFSNSLGMKIIEKLSNYTDIKFIHKDILFLNAYLDGIRMDSIDQDYNLKIEPVIERILLSISDSLGINVNHHTTIKNQLLIHIQAMLYRINMNIEIKSSLTQEIQQEYLALFNSLWLILNEELGELIDYRVIPEDEVSFIVLYLQTMLDKEKESKKILVIHPYGLSISQLFSNKLKQILPPAVLIEVPSNSLTNCPEIEDFDLTISTVELDCSSHKIIYVSPVLTDVDIAKIVKKYNELLVNKSNSHDYKYPVLSKFIDDKFILLAEKNINKRKDDVLKEMHNKLLSVGYVKEGYLESMLERERIGNTEIGLETAVPHGEIKYVKKTVISFYLLREQIKWTESNIRLIIFPVISPFERNYVHELFKEILRLLENKEIQDRLKTIKNVRDLKLLLEGEIK